MWTDIVVCALSPAMPIEELDSDFDAEDIRVVSVHLCEIGF